MAETGEEYHLGHHVNAAMLVVSVPRQATSVQSYYSLIAPQLVSLLFVDNNHLKKTITIAVQKMLEKEPKITKMALMDPIANPLM